MYFDVFKIKYFNRYMVKSFYLGMWSRLMCESVEIHFIFFIWIKQTSALISCHDQPYTLWGCDKWKTIEYLIRTIGSCPYNMDPTSSGVKNR